MIYLVLNNTEPPVNVDNWAMIPVYSQVVIEQPGGFDPDHAYVVEGYSTLVKPDETTDTYVILKLRKEWERDNNRKFATP